MSNLDRVLIIIGNGLGNLVAQSPLVAAMAELSKQTYVWAPKSPEQYLEIFTGMSRVHAFSNVWLDLFHDVDAVVATWLFRAELMGIHTTGRLAKILGPNPLITLTNEVDACMFPARRLGWVGEAPKPFVCRKSSQLSKVLARDRKIKVAISTGRKPDKMWAYKEYPPEYYVESLKILRKKLGPMSVIHVGSEHDASLDAKGVTDARGSYTVPETATVLQNCDVFIGNDTGLSWVASAVGTKVFSIFGPTDPSKCLPPWGARAIRNNIWCQPCQRLVFGVRPDGSKCSKECMLQLSPEVVASEVSGAFI